MPLQFWHNNLLIFSELDFVNSSTESFFAVVVQSTYGGKCDFFGNDHIVMPAGTVDDLDIPALVPASHNADMGVLRTNSSPGWMCQSSKWFLPHRSCPAPFHNLEDQAEAASVESAGIVSYLASFVGHRQSLWVDQNDFSAQLAGIVDRCPSAYCHPTPVCLLCPLSPHPRGHRSLGCPHP